MHLNKHLHKQFYTKHTHTQTQKHTHTQKKESLHQQFHETLNNRLRPVNREHAQRCKNSHIYLIPVAPDLYIN